MNIVALILGVLSGGVGVWIIDGLMIEWIDFSPLSFYLWLIIPVGSFIIGAASALPAYLILRWKHRLPDKSIFIAVIISGLISLWLFKYLDYLSIYFINEDSGEEVFLSDLVGFNEYLPFTYSEIEFSEISIGNGSTDIPEGSFGLGKFGLIVPAIEVLAVALTAWVILNSLAEGGYCKNCNKYHESKTISLTGLTKEDLLTYLEKISLNNISAEKLLSSLKKLKKKRGNYWKNTYKENSSFGLKFVAKYCPNCRKSSVAASAFEGDNDGKSFVIKSDNEDFLSRFLKKNYKI